MSDDQAAPAEEQDKPDAAVEAPETGQAETEAEEKPSVDLEDFSLTQIPEDAGREWFEDKYNDLRSSFTQKTQALAEQRKQVEAQIAFVEALRDPDHPSHKVALAQIGLELEDVEDDDDLDFDDESELEQRLAALEAEREQQAQSLAEQQQAEQLDSLLAERIDDLQRREGVEFNDDELSFLVNAGVANMTQDGPDIDGAYKTLKSILANRQKQWVESKTNAPRTPSGGVPAERELDLTDRSARLQAARERAEAALAE